MSTQIFRENLLYLLKKRKMTKAKLAEKLHVTVSRVNAWAEGRSYPQMRTFIDLCDALEFYDAYQLLTVNLKKGGKVERRKQLPEEVSSSLKCIVQLATEVLEK